MGTRLAHETHEPYASQTMAAPPAGVDWLLGAAMAAVAGTVVRALWFTPVEARQGPAQKIFYLHAPSAFVALYVAFGVMALCSLAYLWLKDPRLDRVAESSAEVGLVFTAVVLTTGPIWGRTVWGAWWTWDMRLTSTLFLAFLILTSIVLRGAVEDPAMRARFSAVFSVLAALLVPFIHLSVYMFRTLHPQPIILKPSEPSLSGQMLTTFFLALGSFMLLYVALLRARYRLATLRDLVARHDAEGG